ncbi:MAG: nucleotidyltransferase family protein, partial [Gemmatimonadota bacterium]
MKIDSELLTDLCERNDIGRLRLFGSLARGEETEDSDIDLIADFT